MPPKKPHPSLPPKRDYLIIVAIVFFIITIGLSLIAWGVEPFCVWIPLVPSVCGGSSASLSSLSSLSSSSSTASYGP